jgi:hypothetical protein
MQFAAFSISKEPVASVSFPLSPQDEASFFAARELHKSKVKNSKILKLNPKP